MRWDLGEHLLSNGYGIRPLQSFLFNPDSGEDQALLSTPTEKLRWLHSLDLKGWGEQPRLLHKLFNLGWLNSSPFTSTYGSIVIGYRPSRCFRIKLKARDQMQMQMMCTFTESNGINPVASGELLNQLTGKLCGLPPGRCFLGLKINGAG